MLRQKPSIHRLNTIFSSSFPQVTSFTSSSSPLSNKAHHWIHQRYRSSATSAERPYPPADPDPVGSHHQNPFGASFQQSSNGVNGGSSSSEYQRSDFGDQNWFRKESSRWDRRGGEVRQGSLNGLRGGNSSVWDQRSNLEVRQVNLNGFSGENSVQDQRSHLGEVRQVTSHRFNGENLGQRSNLGELRRLDSHGFCGENSGWDQRSNLGEDWQGNVNGLYAGNSFGSQRSNFGVGSMVNNSPEHQSGSLGEFLQVSSGGFYAETPVGYQRGKLGEVRPTDSFAGHGENSVDQRSDPGEVQQQSSDWFLQGEFSSSSRKQLWRCSNNNGALHQNSGLHGEHAQMANEHPDGNTCGGSFANSNGNL